MMDAFLVLDSDMYYKDVRDYYLANIMTDGRVNPKNSTSDTDISGCLHRNVV